MPSTKSKEKRTKIIFADFSELDCHKNENGQVNYKELEMCRYLEHKSRQESKLIEKK